MLPVGQCRAPVKFPHNIGLSVSSSSNIQLVVSFIHLLFSSWQWVHATRPNEQFLVARASGPNEFYWECTEKGEEKETDKLVGIVFGTCWNVSGHCIQNSKERSNKVPWNLGRRDCELRIQTQSKGNDRIDLCSPTKTMLFWLYFHFAGNGILSGLWHIRYTWVSFYLHFPLVLCGVPADWQILDTLVT